MKKKAIALILFFISFILTHAQNYPFPQEVAYNHGIIATNARASEIQDKYEYWKTNFYEESGDLARVKFDEPGKTVSEGIAYGMLIFVYMDNSTNNTKDEFDKLWNYYKHFSGSPCGLMSWDINGFSNANDANSATDSEIDVAGALIMAEKQWGGGYLQNAKDIISKFKSCEVNGENKIKPSDGWDGKTNPSYFITVFLESFKYADNSVGSIISTCYSMLHTNSNNSTGLFSDWCDYSGNPQGDFHYDAVRVPWRMANAYSWFGHSDARTLANDVAVWVRQKYNDEFTQDVLSSYSLDGNAKESYGDAAFHGTFMCAGMVDESHQKWVNDGWSVIANSVYDQVTYYNACLRVLYMLLASGNMPDFWNMPPPADKSASFVSAETNASGSIVEITFSREMSSSIPSAPAGFTVSANGSSVFITSIEIKSGDDFIYRLNLESKLTSDDNITVSYSPGSVKTSAGKDLKAFSNEPVTNNVRPPGIYGISDDFNDNTLTGWTVKDAGAYTLTEENQQLTVGGNKDGWEYFYKVATQAADIELNPTLSIRVKSSENISIRIDLMQENGSGGYLKTNKEEIAHDVSGDNQWHTVNYDFDGRFTQGWTDDGQEDNTPLDPTKIIGAAIYINPNGGFHSTIYFDDLLIGDEPAVPISYIPFSNTSTSYSKPVKYTTNTIQYKLPKSGHVILKAYNILGKKIATLVNGYKEAGFHSVLLQPCSLSSGIYFYSIETNEYSAVKRFFSGSVK